jgi:glutaconate CoA-transferase subunit A
VGGRALSKEFVNLDARRSVVGHERLSVEKLSDGMVIGIGGFINAGHPMAIVREIIRQDLKDLTVVGAASSGLELDMLVAAGTTRKVVAPYVGAEGLAAIGPAFRHAVEQELLEVWEVDEAHYYAGLRAAAQGLPFNPWRAGVGTSYPEINPDLIEFTDPVNGERLLAIPAIDLDVAILHAAASDAYGNVQHNGTAYGDRALVAAADYSVVSVEQLVSNQQIKATPSATTVAGADEVIRLPFGAHPFGSDGYYRVDEDHLQEYISAARSWAKSDSRDQLDDYFGRYIRETNDHIEYLEAVGMQSLFNLSEY